ncbi:hypothetical protein VTI74DRAFT_588 [Chaetomium olivicolor]
MLETAPYPAKPQEYLCISSPARTVGFACHMLLTSVDQSAHRMEPRKLHWGLFLTGSKPPAGQLFHATDEGKKPLELYRQIRPSSNPMKSSVLVVCLKIANLTDVNALDACSSQKKVPLMTPSVPYNEPRWTCRVWVKAVLDSLATNNIISLPAGGVRELEQHCQFVADKHKALGNTGFSAAVYNDLNQWMSLGKTPISNSTGGSCSGATPMDIDSTGKNKPKPMDIDSTGKNKPQPMDIDSTGATPRPGQQMKGNVPKRP